MKNSITIIFISILLIALTCTCEKEETENPLPPNTEIGANTFIFRLNDGEIIESEVGYIPANPRLAIFYNHIDPYYNRDFHFKITGRKEILEYNRDVSIIINYLTEEGKYVLKEDINYSYIMINESESLNYYTDEDHTGELIITKLDTINHIISGKFRFNAKQYCWEEECNDVVSVDGQFDVKYIPNKGTRYY